MHDYIRLANAIEAQTGGRFRRAEIGALEQLRKLRLPESVVTFYADHEPAECIEGQVRLWPISEILRENRDYVPGADICKHGYVVFANTICGDAYCFVVNSLDGDGEPRVVLLPHDEDFEEMPAEKIKSLAKPIAPNLAAFLDAYLRGELDEDCIYS
jgi:hypothetical protein